MTQEEKAKAYDEAVERAKIWQEHLYDVNDKDYADELNYIFPELRESEDERISKHLLYHFRNKTKEEWNGMPVKDILAYLEKQEQHKKFRDSIQVGDKVTKNEDGVLVNLSQLKRVAKKDENQGEQKPAWSDEDETMFVNLVAFLEGLCGTPEGGTKTYAEWLKERYKYALPMPHWKPSDEQMFALNIAIEMEDGDILKSLYDDLKKLRDE